MCQGKCELQIKKIVDRGTAEVITEPADVTIPNDKWPAKADLQAAKTALDAKIDAWARPVATSGCTQVAPAPMPALCECHQTDKDPTDAEWERKVALKRTWGHRFQANGYNFAIRTTVEYKIAYVAGACEFLAGMIFYASAGSVPELGGALLAGRDGVITPQVLDKARKAFG